jgi:ribosomal silencing factor RsfS
VRRFYDLERLWGAPASGVVVAAEARA